MSTNAETLEEIIALAQAGRKSYCMRLRDTGGYYVIEWADNDGSIDVEKYTTPDGTKYCAIADADLTSGASVEGPAHEMLALADAIFTGRQFTGRRCAVKCAVGGDLPVEIWNPKTSKFHAFVPTVEAQGLAIQIRALLRREN